MSIFYIALALAMVTVLYSATGIKSITSGEWKIQKAAKPVYAGSVILNVAKGLVVVVVIVLVFTALV